MPHPNMPPIHEHAATRHTMLDPDQKTCGTHRLEASDQPATALTVR